jgi:hypothetical protein
MPRKVKGIRRHGAGWQIYTRVRGKIILMETKERAADTHDEIEQWVDFLVSIPLADDGRRVRPGRCPRENR